MPKCIDETGNIYGQWTVLRRVLDGQRNAQWEYRCACGFVGVTGGVSLRTGTLGRCQHRTRIKISGPEKFTVYALIDTRPSDVFRAEMFYIGRTSQNPATRLDHHIKAVRNGTSDQNGRAVKARIREVLDAGVRPGLVILERTNDPTRERVWIEYFLAHTMPLVNVVHHAHRANGKRIRRRTPYTGTMRPPECRIT